MLAGDDVRVYVSPDEVEMGVGQTIVFTAWGCTLGPAGRLGEDDVPDSFDDDCVLLDINEIRLDEGAPALVVGPEGAFFSITVTAFPEDLESDLTFVGAQVVTDAGSTLASIIARNEALAEFQDSGRPIGDTDGDGDVDENDGGLSIFSAFYLGNYDPALDSNENGVLDEDDWDALTVDMGPMPTPPGSSE